MPKDADIKSSPSTFSAAFKEARARLGAGKTFTYNGKSFSTNIGSEGKKASAPASTSNLTTATRKSNLTIATRKSNPKPANRSAPSPSAQNYMDANPKQAAAFGYATSKKNTPLTTATRKSVPLTLDTRSSKQRYLDDHPAAAEAFKNAASAKRRGVKGFGSGGGVTKQMPTSNAMGSMGMAKGGKAKTKAKAKVKDMMAAAMMKDRIGRALASRGAEAPMAPAPMAPAGPPMGGAPMGMKKGGMTKKCAKGGGIERKGKTSAKIVKMAKGGSIDGIAQRGKTRCRGMS